ncbi:unnamed protein product [Arabis nemorensis]|uniref:Uncharacterized protein n=1 Tax=Arabis nemorensis TaxID=586526 RepID=A0A565B2E9_9BRAS|nr:unnamed protein product [Arabis nemorensis]
MEFHGMKRKDLQALCKKHGIPANLKNSEMASRLASVFEKETEEIVVTETKRLLEDFVEADCVKDNLVVSREVKKVRFSPENEVFEFTRSVEKRKQKSVRSCSQGIAQKVRRSTRIAAKGVTVAECSENESERRREIVETEKECSLLDATNVHKVPRRSKRGSTQEEDCTVLELIDVEQFEDTDISNGLSGNNQDGFKLQKVGRRSTRLIAKRSKGLVDKENKEDESEKNIVKEVSMDFEVQGTGKYHRKDVQDPTVENVQRRSGRFVNNINVQTNAQDKRRSMRLKASAAVGKEESKEERKTKQSKRSVAVNSQEGELVKNKTKEPCKVQTTNCRMKVQDDSQVENFSQRSKRLGKDVNVLMDKRSLVDGNVKAVNHDDLEVEKAPQQSRQREKSVSELLVVGQAQKGDEQSKRTSGNDCEDKKLLRRSKRTALDNMRGQAMANSPKRCSVIDNERDGASVDNVKKLNVNDEVQVRTKFTRNSSRNGSCKAPIIVEGNFVEKKTDATLDSLVKSSKKVGRRMKRGRSAEPGMKTETTFTQTNLTLEKLLDEYAQVEQEEAGGAIVEARGSTKKSKTMNQECVKDTPEGMIEDSPSSSETKAAESVMIIENVLDSPLGKLVDSSQRTNTQEMYSKLMEGEREEKLEQDTVLMALIEDEKEEVVSRSVHLIDRVSPASVQLAVSNPDAELVVPTGHILVKDAASTVIAEENTKTKDQTLIRTPKSELKEHSSLANLAKEEAILENSDECWKEVHSSKDDEKGSSEKEVQAANSHENFSECNTENSSAEELETIKIGCMNVGLCVSVIPEKHLDEDAQLEPEEEGCANVEARGSFKKIKTVNQEFLKDNPQGMADDSPSTSETKAAEPVMNSENELDSTPKLSGDLSLIRNIQESNSELMEAEPGEKQEQDTVLMAATKKDKAESSSLSVFLIECSEVSSPEAELFVETTPPPASVHLAVTHPEAELGVPTGHILVKDISSTFVPEEDIKTKELVLDSISRSELKEHSFVAKLAEAEAIMEISAEPGNDIHSCNDNEKGSLKKDTQLPNLHGNFSEYIAENGSEIEQAEISKAACISAGYCVNRETMDEVKDDSVEKSERTISSERGCKLSGWLSTDFAFPSPKEENVLECLEEEEMKATSNALDDSAVFTTPERNLMLMEQLSENGKIRAAQSETHHNDEAVESHDVVFTTPEKVLLLGDSELYEAKKEEDHTATKVPDESDVLNATEKKCFMLGGSRKNEARNEGESIVVELHDESNSVENFKRDGIERNDENRPVEFSCDFGTCTSPDRRIVLGNLVSDGAGDSGGSEGINRADKSGLLTSLEKQLLYGETEQKEAVKTGEKAAAEFLDEPAVPNNLERHPFPEGAELNEAAKSEENKAVELRVECGIFARTEKHLLFADSGLDGTRKIRDNVALAATCEESFVFTSPERRLLLGKSEPHNAGKQEQKEAEFKDESAFFTRLESRLLLGESGQDRLDLGKSDLSHNASSPKVVLKENSVVRGSHVSALEFTENTIIDSNGRTASKVSYSHEFNAGKEAAGTESQAENVIGLDAIQGTKQRKKDSVDRFAFDIEEGETIIEAGRNVSLSSYVLALPAKGNSCEELRLEDISETIGEISSHLEVSGMVSDIQNHLNDELEGLTIKGNSEADEVVEAKVTKSTQIGFEGNLMLDSSGNSYVSEKTCIVAGAEDEHFGFDFEVDFRNSCEKSGHKPLRNEANGPLEEAISLTPDESTVQNNSNEEVAADEEVIRRETMNEPIENRKEYLNTYESGTLSEKQVRREPLLIYETQVKLKRNDMKENAPNSKIVHNLNITAPRISKRKPLQDMRNN